MNGKEEIIQIKLNQIEKDKDKLINDLNDFILKIKGLNALDKNSKLLLNQEKLNFLKKNIINNLKIKENQSIIYKLLYKATRDGDNGQSFHNKCDNFTPTLTIIKTKDDLIMLSASN